TIDRDFYLDLVRKLEDYAVVLAKDYRQPTWLWHELNIKSYGFDDYFTDVTACLTAANRVLEQRFRIVVQDGEVVEVVEFQGGAKVRTPQASGLGYTIEVLCPETDGDAR
ncbi:MAG: hypothetical protein ACR2PL_25705, partial [Dehalococcoidia bacterium]